MEIVAEHLLTHLVAEVIDTFAEVAFVLEDLVEAQQGVYLELLFQQLLLIVFEKRLKAQFRITVQTSWNLDVGASLGKLSWIHPQ